MWWKSLSEWWNLYRKCFWVSYLSGTDNNLQAAVKSAHVHSNSLTCRSRQISHNLSHGNRFFKPCWKVHKQLQMRFRALALHFPMTEGQPLKHQLCYSLWWPNYVITSVNNTKLPYYTWHSTTVSLETYPIYLLIILIWSILLKLL